MASDHQLTKKERIKLARTARQQIGLYILHLEHNISIDGIDWPDIAWEKLRDAAVSLSDLIERERAVRVREGKDD